MKFFIYVNIFELQNYLETKELIVCWYQNIHSLERRCKNVFTRESYQDPQDVKDISRQFDFVRNSLFVRVSKSVRGAVVRV